MKKTNRHPLKNKWVAVHPDLTTDPLRKQGEIGRVLSVFELDPDALMVCFPDGNVGRYVSDGLTLNPGVLILQALQADRLSAENRNSILTVLKLLGRKNEEALRVAMTNDTTRFFCLSDCQKWLEMKAEQRKNQRKSQKR